MFSLYNGMILFHVFVLVVSAAVLIYRLTEDDIRTVINEIYKFMHPENVNKVVYHTGDRV